MRSALCGQVHPQAPVKHEVLGALDGASLLRVRGSECVVKKLVWTQVVRVIATYLVNHLFSAQRHLVYNQGRKKRQGSLRGESWFG